MAEALGIAGSCVGIAAAIVSVTVKIAQFVNDIRESRKDLDAVRMELSSLQLSLTALSAEEESGFDSIPSLKENLFKVLGDCKTKISEMGAVLDDMDGATAIKRMKWATTGKTKLIGLKLGLESHKLSLDIALDLIDV